MSLIFSCRKYSNTLCGTVVVYYGCQNILWAILVIGMFSTVWWNIFEFCFMSGGIFSTGKNGVENLLSKTLVSKIFHHWLSNIFHCWWIHLSKIFCRKLYVFPNNAATSFRQASCFWWDPVRYKKFRDLQSTLLLYQTKFSCSNALVLYMKRKVSSIASWAIKCISIYWKRSYSMR